MVGLNKVFSYTYKRFNYRFKYYLIYGEYLPEKEITIELKHPETIVLLIFCFIILFLELQITFNSPIAFGDEGFHTRLAQWTAEKQEIPKYIPFEGTNLIRTGYYRPPFWNLLEASFLYIFGFNEFIIRFLTPFIAMLTGITIYLLTKRLFDKKIGFIAAVLTITIPSFVTYSVLFYTDALLTFFMSLFFLLFLVGIKENNRKYLILSSMFGAFAFLTKESGLAVLPFFVLAFVYEILIERRIYASIKKYGFLVLIFALILSGYVTRNLYFFKHPTCYPTPFIKLDESGCSVNNFQEKYQFSGRVEQVGTEQNVYSMGITNYLEFAYGRMLWPYPVVGTFLIIFSVVFGFLGGLILLYAKGNFLNYYIAIFLLLCFYIFYTTTGRAEDTARFTLGWISAIALVSAVFFGELYDFVKLYQKYVALTIFIIIIFLGYQNFKEKLDIMYRVKQFSPLFFEACDWVKQNTPKDSLMMTVWAHRAVYNCQRNTINNMADIVLSQDLNHTLDVARKNGITHLFIQKFSIDAVNQHLGEKYDLSFVQFLESHPEKFVKIYENGPPLQQCIQRGGCDGNIVYEIKLS
jgi:hypothetical protein